MGDEAWWASGGLVGFLEGVSINTDSTANYLTNWAANSSVGLGVSSLTGDALSVWWVPGGAVGAHINALTSRVEVLLSLAALEVNALSLLESVVSGNANNTESEIIDLQAVVGDTQTVSIDAPLVSSAFGFKGTSSGEVDVVVGFTFNTVIANQIESFAVFVRIDTFSISEFLSFLTSSETIDDLEALTVSNWVVGVFAAEAVTVELIVGVAKRWDVGTEDTVLGGNLTIRANNTLADSTIDIVTLDTVEAFSEVGIEVKAFSGNGDTAKLNDVLSGGALDYDLSASSISVELIEFADAGETFSWEWVEGIAAFRDIVASIIGLILSVGAGNWATDAWAVEEIVVGWVRTSKAGTSEFIEITTEGVDIVAFTEVEELTVRAGGVGKAASVDDEVSINTLLADTYDVVVAGTRGTFLRNGGSAALEVLVVVSEWWVEGAFIAVWLPSETDVAGLEDSDVDWDDQKIVSWLQEVISGIGSNSSWEDWISAVDVGSDLFVGEEGEDVGSCGIGPVIGGVDSSNGVELRGERISISEGDGEEREVDFSLWADV